MSTMSGVTPQKVTFTVTVDIDPAAHGFELSTIETKEILVRAIERTAGLEVREVSIAGADVDPTPILTRLAYERGVAHGYVYRGWDDGDSRVETDKAPFEFADSVIVAGASPDQLKQLYEAYVEGQLKGEVGAAQEVPADTVKEEGVGS